jgi:hypothetical protein
VRVTSVAPGPAAGVASWAETITGPTRASASNADSATSRRHIREPSSRSMSRTVRISDDQFFRHSMPALYGTRHCAASLAGLFGILTLRTGGRHRERDGVLG